MMHVKRASVDADREPRAGEAIDIRAEVLGLVIVGENSDGDVSLMRLKHDLGEPVVGDGENTNVDRFPRAPQELFNRARAVLARAEEGFGPGLGICLDRTASRRIKRRHNLFEPRQDCRVNALRQGLASELESMLAKFCDRVRVE